MKPVYIVGNGMFGRIASDVLTTAGVENIVFDSELRNSGTRASGNITKPSWVSGLGETARQAYRNLDSLYGLEKFSPTIAFGKTIDLFFVPKVRMPYEKRIVGNVTEVGDGYLVIGGERKEGIILVAAGVWSEDLVSMPTIDSIVGCSFVFKKPNHTPQFSVWAPYKQAISYGYGLDDRVWFGDGTAIKAKNWQKERIDSSLLRAVSHGLNNPIEINVGYRPYVKGHKNGYFTQVFPNTWVSTGGGKNGIVLAMIQAQQFLKEIT